jgi:cobalt-precorrin-5B (C1)-methyltransferase
MAFEHYIRNGAKRLRCGYTTGTCAALAAKGAVQLLLTGEAPDSVGVMTGKGILVETEPVRIGPDPEALFPEARAFVPEGYQAACAIRKDAGDDIDATANLLICAAVRRSAEPGVQIDGGRGIGRVTKPGLDQPVGNAAINRVPRQMIAEAVTEVCDAAGYDGGIQVIIFAPEGETVGAKTFNPVLGVCGGISILGTSGIVEPMSEQAWVDTIEVEMHQHALTQDRMILIPGNYGEEFLEERGLSALGVPVVKISNFLGEALDIAAAEGFRQVLLAAHAGKLVKAAGGIMNTHSRWADCRTELFCAHAAVCGADTDTCRALMGAATTDACIGILEQAGLREPVLASLMGAVQSHLERRAAGQYRIGAVMFSKEYGTLGCTEPARELLEAWRSAAGD